MVIGNRLKGLRESKKLSQGTSRNGQAYSGATSHGLKMVIRFLLSRPIKNSYSIWRKRLQETSLEPLVCFTSTIVLAFQV